MNDGIESESERMEPVMIYCKLKSPESLLSFDACCGPRYSCPVLYFGSGCSVLYITFVLPFILL